MPKTIERKLEKRRERKKDANNQGKSKMRRNKREE